MADHSSLTDPELHEPKGVSVAADGDVLVADGLGSADWTSKSTLMMQPAYGSMYIEDNNAATLITTADVFEPIVGTTVPGPLYNFTYQSGKLTALVSGVYLVHLAATILNNGGTGATNTYKMTTCVGSTDETVGQPRLLVEDGEDDFIGGQQIVTVTAGQLVYPKIANFFFTHDVKVIGMSFTIHMIKG